MLMVNNFFNILPVSNISLFEQFSLFIIFLATRSSLSISPQKKSSKWLCKWQAKIDGHRVKQKKIHLHFISKYLFQNRVSEPELKKLGLIFFSWYEFIVELSEYNVKTNFLLIFCAFICNLKKVLNHTYIEAIAALLSPIVLLGGRVGSMRDAS